MGTMVYIRNGLYRKIIQLGYEPKDFVNEAVEEKLKRIERRRGKKI